MSKELAKQEPQNAVNPYAASSVTKKEETESGTAVESQRATIETMTAYEIAKRFPRNMVQVSDKILAECSRPTLAEISTYSYSKGGQDISGPTIRLMEAVARAMGNIDFGWQCLESSKAKSTIRAFAYDLENNIRRTTTFDVSHWRDTKSGGYAIKDEREIYELQANKAMRRVRGCLEGLVARDIIDMALEQCELTNRSAVDMSAEGIKKLLDAFAKFGVNRAMIEESRQGMKIEAMKPPQIVGLRKNHAAIRDGIAAVEDIFDIGLADKPKGGKKDKSETDGQPDLKGKIDNKKSDKTSDKTPTPEDDRKAKLDDITELLGAKSWADSDFPADAGKGIIVFTDDDNNELRLTESEAEERAQKEKTRRDQEGKPEEGKLI